MYLRYITCSDPREHNSIESIIDLARLPHTEIAVQCHPSKMSNGMPRNIWFNDLLRESTSIRGINLAIHINSEWADDICAKGCVPQIILDWLKVTKMGNSPAIKRVQLNMPQETADNINVAQLAKIFHCFPNQEFILQYNNKTKKAVKKMHHFGTDFSLLFDASGGNGIAPKLWEKPVYDIHPMGYSGGMSPDNVNDNLNKINKLVPEKSGIWIDAEGKLKSLIDGKDLFDVSLAKKYVMCANRWQNQK